LNSQGKGAKPGVLPKPDLRTIPNQSSIIELNALNSPHDPLLELGESNSFTTKDIWILGIVLSIYHTFPKLPIIQTVSFNLGGKEAEVYIGKIKNT
jgi:hypothetical protein